MIKKVFTVIFYVLLFCIITNIIQTNHVFANNMKLSSYSISDFEIMEDPTGTYSFEKVSAPESMDQYIPYPEKNLSLGITKSVYWIRFKLPNANREESYAGQFLQLNNGNIDKIDIYLPIITKIPTINPQYMIQKVGVRRPSSNQAIMDNTWVFQLPNELNDTDFLYLRLESTSALRLPILLWDSSAFIATSFLKNMGFGAFYGTLLAMIIFNLFIYSALRDKVYFSYVLYISFMFLYQFQVHGHLRMLIDIPYEIYNGFFWFCLATAFICSVYFTRQFLQVKVTAPSFDKILTGFVMISILYGVLGILDYNLWANHLAHLLGILGPIVYIILATIRLRQGFQPARYYLIAWGVLSIGIVVWSLSAYIPGAFPAVDYLLVATASEAVLLSLALADRVKTLRLEGEVLHKRVKRYQLLSLQDGLTGLYNKRCFDIKMSEELTLALQSNRPLSLLVIDIDKFKSFNDHYGHWEGDKVIIRLGQTLLHILTNNQPAFRYGGEEFVVLLPNTICSEAYVIAENIRKTFMSEPFTPVMKPATTVTISIGLAELIPNDNHNSLFQRADKALYKAKKKGRNQTIML